MNFFEAQDNARRKTWQLLLLFGAAVISLILMTNVLVAAVVFYSNTMGYAGPVSLSDRLTAMPAETWALISFAVISVIALASGFKYLALQGGGRAIAEMLGGRPLNYDASRGNTRRLLNIVEEMAIASGIPVPPVYLIDESSINAFAAGFSQDDAVIGVNQGTIDQLNRDELQGVIAHEFSHIVNGDTRINLRLIAALHGIIFLSMIGHTILRGMRYSGSRSRKGGGNAPVLALGLGLLVIGYAGTFFGNLIKAAVSRQREYLADAAAVQFTRNPDGIANALKRIGGLSDGSTMSVVSADEASHQFFGQIHPFFLNSIMATHPPLPKRITAIDPGWNGEFLAPRLSAPEPAESTAQSHRSSAGAAGFAQAGVPAAAATGADEAQRIVDQVGTLAPAGLEAATRLIESTDSRLREAAHDSWGSRGLIYAMLIDQETRLSAEQQAELLQGAETGVPEYTATLLDAVAGMDPSQKLTLVEMAMPALKSLSEPQYQKFISNCIKLIKADGRISLFEWVLHRLLLKELRPHFEGPRPVRIKHRSIRAVRDESAVLLSVLAQTGNTDPHAIRAAFTAGADALGEAIEFNEEADPNYQNLNTALSQLQLLKPLLKPKLIKACAATVLADRRVLSAEGALLQGVAAALDCPLPPTIYEHDSADD